MIGHIYNHEEEEFRITLILTSKQKVRKSQWIKKVKKLKFKPVAKKEN